MVGPRERGRKLSRGEIIARLALMQDGELVLCARCSGNGKPKVVYPTFGAARRAASELLQSDERHTELHLHPCRERPDWWHLTRTPPAGQLEQPVPRGDGQMWPPRRRWTIRRVRHPKYSGVQGLSHKIGDHVRSECDRWGKQAD